MNVKQKHEIMMVKKGLLRDEFDSYTNVSDLSDLWSSGKHRYSNGKVVRLRSLPDQYLSVAIPYFALIYDIDVTLLIKERLKRKIYKH